MAAKKKTEEQTADTFLVTARKWRPMVFGDIAGQAHVTTTLRNALASNRLSHSYIFSGPRGVGKTTAARILAKAINCEHPVDYNPDNTCDLCREITEGRSVNVFEIDGASNRGVDEIRNLREAVRYAPVKGKYKVYVIDEVHMLTKEAFNALLKTLEEPPPSIVFIFATTEIHKVPQTILSRCQRFDFRRITVDEIISRLRFIAGEEKIAINDDALLLIAKRGDGSLRDAQSIFDQIISFCGTEKIVASDIISMFNMVDEEIYFRLTDIISAKDVKAGLLLADEVMTRGYDLREFLNGIIEHFRNMLVVRTTGSARLIETSGQSRARLQEMSEKFSETDLLRLIKCSSETESAIRWSQSSGGGRYKLEIGIVQMIKMDRSVEISHLLEQLDAIKKKLNSGPAAVAPVTAAIRSGAVRAEAPIQGSVRASQPHLRPDQIVSPSVREGVEPTSVYNAKSYSTATQQAAIPHETFTQSQQSSELLRPISIMEASGKWGDFIAQARKQRIAVGTMLSETTIMNVQGNSIQIGCPDDFHLEGLKRHRSFLLDLAQQVYGAKVRLETLLSTNLPTDSQAGPVVATASAPLSAPASGLRQHPMVQAIMEEFGAKEMG